MLKYRTATIVGSCAAAVGAGAFALAVLGTPLAAQDKRGGGDGAMSTSPGGAGGAGTNAQSGDRGNQTMSKGGDRDGSSAGTARSSGGSQSTNDRSSRSTSSDRGNRTTERSGTRNDRSARSFSGDRGDRTSERSRTRVDIRESQNRRHGRHNGVGVTFGYDGGGYSGSCSYYHRRAVATGSGYWWRRYHRCIGD
jgi:hypothetical protein